MIFDRFQELKMFCDAQRSLGKSIVFTNGAFDLFHIGHLDSLERAALYGDILVVGVNSDASVKALKGDSRPIIQCAERMAILDALKVVDAVCPFDEETPKRIIEEAVQPDVIVKGGHYKIHEIVGHEFVLPRGGMVYSMPIMVEQSTSKIAKRIREMPEEERIIRPGIVH